MITLLVGMIASGKSTVSAALAAVLGFVLDRALLFVRNRVVFWQQAGLSIS